MGKVKITETLRLDGGGTLCLHRELSGEVSRLTATDTAGNEVALPLSNDDLTGLGELFGRFLPK